MSKLPRKEILILVGLVLFNLGLRLFRLDTPNEAYFDEADHYLPAARAYWQGDFSPNFEHPLLGKFLIGGGITLFGDNPWGWRVPGVIFGTVAVVLTYFLAKKMFASHPGKVWIATVAAGLLSLDFMWFTTSRVAILETFFATFALAAIYFLYSYLDSDELESNTAHCHSRPLRRGASEGGNPEPKPARFPIPLQARLAFGGRLGMTLEDGGTRLRNLILTGLFLGLALAVKWSALLIFLAITILFFLFHQKSWRHWLGRLVMIGAIAGGVYLFSYLPYFTKNSFSDFLSLHQRMITYHQEVNGRIYDSPPTLKQLVVDHPWLWVLDPPMGYFFKDLGENTQLILSFSHPLVFWLGIFALFKFGLGELKQRKRGISFLLVTFLAFYLPWFFVPRYQFIYYLLSAIPLICIAAAYFLYPRWLDKQGRWNVFGYLTAVVVAFLILYSIVAAIPVGSNLMTIKMWLVNLVRF